MNTDYESYELKNTVGNDENHNLWFFFKPPVVTLFEVSCAFGFVENSRG